MTEYSGKKIFNGIAIGRIKYMEKSKEDVKRVKVENVEREVARYEKAKGEAICQLNALYEKALAEVGADNAEIFQVHAMIIEDEDFSASVKNIIETQAVNAEYAVAATGDNLAEMFEKMDNDYMKARSADIKDITERIIHILCGHNDAQNDLQTPAIIVADDLAPSETVQMEKQNLLAFVTKLGSANSHTAILARTMGIPALVGVSISPEMDGKMGIVDGYEGKFIVDPDAEILQSYFDKKREEDEKRALLLQLKGKDNRTKSGKSMELFANIAKIDDLAEAIANDAGGVGLFRSEFLYLESDHLPTEEEQFVIYKKAVETMGGKKVIIRTMDIGADKQVDYLGLEKEDNPALGYRAIRICLTKPEIFKTQLRALYRASAFGKLSIMYPMIISVEEVLRIKDISKCVREELKKEGIAYGEVEEGIMIETPAACLMSDELAKFVDFFSIGTNDLTQYTLAIDRQNAKLDEFYDAHHPAIVKLMRMVVANAHKEGIWVGVCGELGADVTMTEKFVEMGIDELSVSPGCILSVRKAIREVN